MGQNGKLLITGCSGFIGNNLTRYAMECGYQVVGLDRRECQIKDIEMFKGDITDVDLVQEATKGVQNIIHLAAITSNIEFEKDPASCYKINVGGFINVLNAAKSNGVNKVLYASSAAVYTESGGFSENTMIDVKKQRNHYAKSKLINEMIADSYIDIYDMNIIGMRFFNVFGEGENDKGDYASIISRFIKENKNGMPLVIYGDGKQSRDFIYISDLSKIIIMLLKSGQEQLYNIGTGVATSYEEIANIINSGGKKYVDNPLSSYQYLTKADTTRLLATIGKFQFMGVPVAIRKLLE